MRKVTFLMLPLLLVTMVSCGLKDYFWNGDSDVSLSLDRNVLQQVNRSIFEDNKFGGAGESKIVDFICTISGDYSDSKTQSVNFANEISSVNFTFTGVPVDGIINVEMILTLQSTGQELYRGQTNSVRVLPNNSTVVKIRLSKSDDKLRSLFPFSGKWNPSKKNAILGNGRELYYLEDDELAQTQPPKILKESGVQDFCFDSEGEVWYVVDGDDVQLYKNSEKIMGWSEWTEPFYKNNGGFKLAYDKVTDEILIYQNYEDDHIFVVYNTKDNSNTELESDGLINKLYEELNARNIYSFSNIAVHNSSIYSTVNYETYDGEKYEYHNCLIKYEVNGEELSLSKVIDLKNVLGISDNKMSFFTPTDMEIQSDLLFVTYQVNSREGSSFADYIYNYGGVLVFDLDDLSQVIPSGSSKTGVGAIKEKRNVLIDKMYYLEISGGNFTISPEEPDDDTYLKDTFKPNFSVYSPDSATSNNYLFGPQQIIAIKPKKLVVLDKGVFLYVDGDEPKYKVVNRVVEIDFESKVFEKQTPVSIEKATGMDEVEVYFRADENLAGKEYEYDSSGTPMPTSMDYCGEYITFCNADN